MSECPPTRKYRLLHVDVTDDQAMVDIAADHGATIREIYRRAVALYILTHGRIESMGDYWPGSGPEGES